jgi:amino acid adenylation domain-containing protein
VQLFTGQNVGNAVSKRTGFEQATGGDGTVLVRPQVQFEANDARPRIRGSIAATVADVARADPDRVALRLGDQSLTYGALLARADGLSRRLVNLGVGPEVPVGICLPRTFDRVVAMFATLCAGGAFIPLDPQWPKDRLVEVLADAGARVVVASDANLSGGAFDLLELPLPEPAAPAPPVSLAAGVRGEQLAYIIYTSGSTGRPKGVEITHANLANLICWHLDAFNVTKEDRASCIAGLGFDATVWEIWPYLVAGASISIVNDDARESAGHLLQWLVRECVTIAFVPTPLAETLIQQTWPIETSLRCLLTGGDALHNWPAPDLPFDVINNYGPTECTVVTTSGPVTSPLEPMALPSIGRPIAGVTVRILGPDGSVLPDGAIGELCVGGACVGRGYRGRPDLTSEKFFAFMSDDGNSDRLYRTGDLCAVLPNGEIAFHGRLDTQSKVRGHRVEIDEITAVLNRHAAVAQSAVVVGGDSDQAQLSAYIVPSSRGKPRASDIRDLLMRSLPEFMIPSRFILVDFLPLTSNGKLDRCRLPKPNEDNVLRDAPYRAPATVAEARLATIMAELLGFGPIGADDNFFLLGGHSLLGSQLALRVREAFGAAVTLRDVFRTQTVSRLAAKIEELIVTKLQNLTDEEAEKLAAE